MIPTDVDLDMDPSKCFLIRTDPDKLLTLVREGCSNELVTYRTQA